MRTPQRHEIPARERLILALDVADPTEARDLVEGLGGEVLFYKIGLELFLSGGYFQLSEWLQHQDKKVFADLKLFDVPQTVASAVRQLRGKGISFLTVHGNDAILEAACEAAGEDDLRILAVTALTSLDEADMRALGFQTDIPSLVLSRAERAASIGCAGVIASGREAAPIREALGDRLLIVVPGIRPGPDRVDDQKRTVDVEQAFEAGADYIVIGRPIRNAADPSAAAGDVQRRIGALFRD